MDIALPVNRSPKLNNIILVIFWPAVALFCIYLYNLDEIFVDRSFKIWSIAHIFLHLAPVYLYFLDRKSPNTFPFIEILALFNVVHYGLPLFFIQLEDFQLGVLTLESMQITFQCYVIFYCVYYILRASRLKIKGVEFTSQPENTKIIKYFGYILLLCYLGRDVFPAIYHIGYVGFFAYIGLFIYLWKNKHLKLWEKIVFLIFMSYEFAGRGLDGLISPFALLILFIGLSIVMSKSNKLILIVLVSLFIWFYSIFSNIKFEYRNQVWYGGQSLSLFQKVELISTLSAESKLNAEIPLVKEYKGKEHFLWRFSYQLSAMSLVLEMTPGVVPYWDGSSYTPMLSKFIPRFMWPDKPEENMGFRFGITYNIINRWNTRTSMNTPILPELYMNFGFFGLYLGCVLMGVLYFLLASWFGSKSVSYVSRVIGMSIIFPLMIWESNFSLIFGNLILITFVFYWLYKLLEKYVK